MSETEKWRPVLGYEGIYEISNEGALRSVAGRVKKSGFYGRPYRSAILSKDGKCRTVDIHTLVCEAFHGPRPPGQWARHLDGDRSNNRDANLAWGTPKDNMRDQYIHGTRIRGVSVSHAVLDDAKVREIRRLSAQGLSQTKIARIIGASQPTVSTVVRGTRWQHVA